MELQLEFRCQEVEQLRTVLADLFPHMPPSVRRLAVIPFLQASCVSEAFAQFGISNKIIKLNSIILTGAKARLATLVSHGVFSAKCGGITVRQKSRKEIKKEGDKRISWMYLKPKSQKHL